MNGVLNRQVPGAGRGEKQKRRLDIAYPSSHKSTRPMTHIDARSTELERRALSRSLETTNDRGVEPVNCEQIWPY